MFPQRVRRTQVGLPTFALLSVLAVGNACTCGKPPITTTDQCVGVPKLEAGKTNVCASNDECGDHFACRDVKDKDGVRCCVFADRPCKTEGDCCPGQTCNPDARLCFDRSISCTKDEDCGDLGDRFCEPWTDTYTTSNRCRFKTCGALGECPIGQSCFQGECMADLPCEGSCKPGEACVPSVNKCQDYTTPTGRELAACPMSCAPGFIGTFKDPRNIWDSCQLPAVKCVCAELPGLRSNDLGRFSAIGASPGKALYVSAYDGEFGDLVLMKYGLDGNRQSLEYVDGVPQANVKYGPSGARGGIIEPGPDVGRYTDLAVAGDGRVFVSYYDVTNGDLKVAVRSADGKWATHTVDGAKADLGLYTSIALDSGGRPAVSYFQRAGELGFDVTQCPAPRPTGAIKYITALKYAHATSASPAAAADWVVKTVACLERPPPPCADCLATEACADPGSGKGCFATASTCTPACDANKEVCVTAAAASKCAKKATVTQLADVPIGVGVFTSLAFKGDDAFIAFARRTAGATTKDPVKSDLMGVTVNPQNAVGTAVVLDATGDTGYFPDLKIEPGTNFIGIGYHDFTSKAFKFYYAAQLQAGVTTQVIDKGLDAAAPGNQSFVGTDSAILFTTPGKALAVYQDPTKGDLKVARRAAAWTVANPASTTGAVGFFADAVWTDGKVYASHARLRARIVRGDARVDNTLLLEQLTP